MIVIKIAGCNGSGKTTLVRALLEDSRYRFKPVVVDMGGSRKTRPIAYVSEAVIGPRGGDLMRMVILGSYETACGGMDTINNQVEKMALLRKYCLPGNLVIFEGVLTGVTYGEMGALSESPEHAGRWLYAFMDTPFEVCVDRVLARREARRVAKGGEPNQVDLFDPEKTMRPKMKAVESVMNRVAATHNWIHTVDHTLAPKEAAKEMMKAALKLAKKVAA